MKLNIQRRSRKDPGILLIQGPVPLGREVEINLALVDPRGRKATFERPLVEVAVLKQNSEKAYWRFYFPPTGEECFDHLANLKGTSGIPAKAKRVIRAIFEDPDQLLPWVVLLTTQPGRRHGFRR